MECFGHKCLCEDACNINKECIVSHPLFADCQESVYNKVRDTTVSYRHKQIINLLQEKQPPKVSRKQIEKHLNDKGKKRPKRKIPKTKASTKERIKKVLHEAEKCFYCELEFNTGVNSNNAGIKTRDHIIPLNKNGKHKEYNMVAACRWCNEEKGNLLLVEFYDKIEATPSLSAKNRDKETILKNIELLIKKVDPYYNNLFIGSAPPPHYRGEPKTKKKKSSIVGDYLKRNPPPPKNTSFPTYREVKVAVKQHFKKDCKDIALSVNDNTRGGKIIPIDEDYVLYLQSQTPEQLQLAKLHGWKIARLLTQPQTENFHIE